MKILLNELNKIQEKNGFITEEEIKRLSQEWNLSKSQLFGIISFYSRLYTNEQGKYFVRVCKSLSCSMNGASNLAKKIADYLRIGPGEITQDKNFSYELIECLGYCHEGAVMTINDKAYTKVGPSEAINLLKKIAKVQDE